MGGQKKELDEEDTRVGGCSKDPAGPGLAWRKTVFIHLHMMEGGGDSSSERFPVSDEHPLPFSVYLPVSVSLSVCVFLPCCHLHGRTNKHKQKEDTMNFQEALILFGNGKFCSNLVLIVYSWPSI